MIKITRIFTILMAGMTFLCDLYSQTDLRLYPYRMNPREHPDEMRRYVKSPDMSLFDNKTQFISLRDLSGEDYKKRIDQWVDKDKLGNILWVSYPLIYQDNLKEVVAEIKRRNLYLFDLWGYVPGSGPGGYWQQFIIPDGVLDLFKAELGDRWLGMDNGEQDGRYVGGFAPQMFPLGADRKQQYFNFQRHFEFMGDRLGNKLATLVSLNFGHHFLKEGIYTLIGAETAQGLPNGQIYYSFIRGAGKQYGVNWFGNASVWNRWGWKSYDSGAKGIEDDYESGGPEKGTSLSLLKRLMYDHIAYNCVALGFESSMYMDGKTLSPIGKIQQEAVKWLERNGDPGVMFTPVALMTDFFAGWSFPRHLYSGNAYKVWGNLPYEAADYLTDNVLDVLYPGYQDASYFKDERGFIAPTPYGDMADCILSDAPLWLLEQYPVLVIAGGLSSGIEINEKLEAYVQNGGHLVIPAGALQNMPVGIAGITAGNRSIHCTGTVQYGEKKVDESGPYLLVELSFPTSAEIIMRHENMPAAIRLNHGRGKVTVFASPFGLPETPQCPLPATVKEEKPLARPFPMLNHVRMLLQEIFTSQQIFHTNPELSMITCVKNKNEFTVFISNDQWTPKEFDIRASTGKIVSMKELPVNTSEMDKTGYKPKVVTANTGKNTGKTIAGGSIRIFNISLEDARAEVMPAIKPTPNPVGRALVLRNVHDLKEEILLRPTFFSHYDRVVVDWRYLNNRDGNVLEQEAGWIGLQKLKISVDLTSGLNLFPDLRIVNNDPLLYEQSIHVIKNVIDKMAVLGADELIVSVHRMIENNFSEEEFRKSLVETFQTLADYAAAKNIRLVLRHAINRMPRAIDEADELVNRVNRPNFSFAPSIGCLLMDEQNLDKNMAALQKMKINHLFISAPQYDIHQQPWSANAPIFTSDKKTLIKKVLNAFPEATLIMDGLYTSHDEEYLDSKEIKKLSCP